MTPTEGHVYVMRGKDGLHKVGISKSPRVRRYAVRAAEIVYLTEFRSDISSLEKSVHGLLTLAGYHVRGEWFSADLQTIKQAFDRAERISSGLELPLDGVRKVPWTSVTIAIPECDVARINALRREEKGIPPLATMVRIIAAEALLARGRD